MALELLLGALAGRPAAPTPELFGRGSGTPVPGLVVRGLVGAGVPTGPLSSAGGGGSAGALSRITAGVGTAFVRGTVTSGSMRGDEMSVSNDGSGSTRVADESN